MRTALVAGATGLVGSQLLKLLLEDERYASVIAVGRQPLKDHPKLRTVVAEFAKLGESREDLAADDIFCCLGTTMKKAKSKEAFRAVDLDYPVALAKIGLQNGARQYLLVSSLGADRHSSIFYNRVKGEAEEAIRQTGLERVVILRPSLLLGNRPERRPAEEVATKVYGVLNFLIPRKYKAIDAGCVARAMVALSEMEETGQFIYESDALQKY